MKVEGIQTMPLGLALPYLSHGVAVNATAAVRAADLKSKSRTALAAWNMYYKLSTPSRAEAARFVASAAARRAGVENKIIPHRGWWSELASYKFLLVPMGSRIQCFKMIEALMVLTIPIVQRGWYRWENYTDGNSFLFFARGKRFSNGRFGAHDDLRKMGFPVVVVDEWAEVTKKNMSRWWRELSPRLLSFRERCLTVDSYWRLATWQTQRCF
eukprot:TRINITY_DN7558_c1_g1_i1.p1 TRINITY_DN7558_c1_g1~~TRINITY_DN7558_c1_g1_i1.p1  ORF type:complete len:213 (+),score=31.79 TRINITY_DN7558_c1_g1_i1:450-1088(+)